MYRKDSQFGGRGGAGKEARFSPGLLFVVVLASTVVLLHYSPLRRAAPVKPAAPAGPALRCIVLSGGTRVSSLHRLMRSIFAVIPDGDRIDIDVWLDLPPGSPPESVLKQRKQLAAGIQELGSNGTYKNGALRAHIWPKHMGLRGQWLEAWHESTPGGLRRDTPEIGLILEDDLELSPYAWRWLKAAHVAYGTLPHVAGFSLQRLQLCAAFCKDLKGGPEQSGGGFLYPIVGTWGYSPTARHFVAFREWFYSRPPGFKPYVPGLSPTSWYRRFEREGTEKKRMWSMHHIKYTDTHEDRYTVYAKPRGDQALSVNHREPGANYHKKDKVPDRVLRAWDPELVRFSSEPLVLNYRGQVVRGKRLPRQAPKGKKKTKKKPGPPGAQPAVKQALRLL